MSRMLNRIVLSGVLTSLLTLNASAGPFDFLRAKSAKKSVAAPSIVTANAKSRQTSGIRVTLTSGPCYSDNSAAWGGESCYDNSYDCCRTSWRESCQDRAIQYCRKCCDQSYYCRCSPYCTPGWGYYPTCWRRMPECWQCPKESIEVMPSVRPAVELPPQAPPVPEADSSLPE